LTKDGEGYTASVKETVIAVADDKGRSAIKLPASGTATTLIFLIAPTID